MRITERIDPVLKNINWEQFITCLGIYKSRVMVRAAVKLIRIDIDRIRAAWRANPDLRLAQILVMTKHILNTPGLWYYRDEIEFLLYEQKVDPREITFWGQRYLNENNKSPAIRYKLIKDMDTDHIKQIIQDFKQHKLPLSKAFYELFKNELTFRKSLTKIESKRNRINGNSRRAVAAKSRSANKTSRGRKSKSKNSRSIRVSKSR